MFNHEKYVQLLQQFNPCVITSEEDFNATQKVIDQLIDKDKLSEEEQVYLNVLGSFVYEYENPCQGVTIYTSTSFEEN